MTRIQFLRHRIAKLRHALRQNTFISKDPKEAVQSMMQAAKQLEDAIDQADFSISAAMMKGLRGKQPSPEINEKLATLKRVRQQFEKLNRELWTLGQG